MKTRWYVWILLCLSFGCSSEEDSAVVRINPTLPDRPNILWIVAEDLGHYIPPFGDSTIQTPNLSRLAEEGVCYDRFFTAAPVCAPARASIALGMYPSAIAANHMRTGPWWGPVIPEETIKTYSENELPQGIEAYDAMPPAEARMVSEYLRMQGYYCTNNAKQDYQFRRPVTSWDESSNQAHWRNRAADQPFYSVFNIGVTHESQIWKRAEMPLLLDSTAPVPIPPYLPSTPVGVRDVQRMYSNIMEMDRRVGEIMQELEDDGLLESTVIFWYTDHGGPLPRQKRLLYDSGLHVPLIVRFPHQAHAGERSDEMLSFIDLAPTLMSIVGISPPGHMHGRAFLGAHATNERRQYIHAAADRFDESYDCNRAVRDQRYKYIRYYQPDKPMFLHVAYRDQQPIMRELYRLRDEGKLTSAQALWFRERKPDEELFDTYNDPHEIKNLAEDDDHQEKLRELSTECDRWLDEIDDLGILPEPELIRRIWPEGIHPQTGAVQISTTADGKLLLKSATAGASLGYRVKTEDENAPWTIYQEPFEFDGQPIQTVAHRIGYKSSYGTYPN